MLSMRTKQSNLATAATVDSLIRVSSEPGNIVPEVEDDSDLVGGTEEPTTQEVSVRNYNLPLDQSKVKPNTLAFVLGAAMGTVTSTTPAASDVTRLHAITQKAATDFDTFTVEELFATSFQRKYIGCIVDSFTLDGERRNFFSLSSQVYGSGKYATGTADVSEVSEVSIHTRNAVVFFGTGYAGGVPTQSKASATIAGSSDESANIESLSWGYNNNVDLDFLPYFNTGVTWGRAERGTRSQTLDMTMLFQNLDEADNALSQTAVAIEVKAISETAVAGVPPFNPATPLDTEYNYGFTVIWPKVQYVTANTAGAAGDRVTVSIVGKVLDDGTYDAARAWVWNGVFDYLQ